MPSRIGDALYWHATYTPNRIAIVSSGGTQTYAQLWTRVCRLSSALAELGLAPGDRIALLMQNSSRYLEVYQARALMGAAVVPLNFRFTASEIEYVVSHSDARALLFDDSFVENRPVACERGCLCRRRYVVTMARRITRTHSYDALMALRRRDPASMAADLSACYSKAYTSARRVFEGCVNPHREFADCLRRIQQSTA